MFVWQIGLLLFTSGLREPFLAHSEYPSNSYSSVLQRGIARSQNASFFREFFKDEKGKVMDRKEGM